LRLKLTLPTAASSKIINKKGKKLWVGAGDGDDVGKMQGVPLLHNFAPEGWGNALLTHRFQFSPQDLTSGFKGALVLNLKHKAGDSSAECFIHPLGYIKHSKGLVEHHMNVAPSHIQSPPLFTV